MKNIKAVKEAKPFEHDVDASSIGYAAVANAMPSTQEVAPFLGRTYAAGSCSQDELADKMVEAGCQMTAAEIKRVWNGTGSYLIDTMPEAPRSFDIGFVRLFPSISGTFDSADGDFDKERNKLLVAAAPSATIRNALAGGTPYHAAGTGIEPSIGNVTWNNMADTVKSGEPFTIIGLWLTFLVGDEYAEMKLPGSGGVVSVSVETQVSADDGCQRLVGRLSRAVDACEGAVLTVYTHGADRTSVLRPVLSGKLTVLADDVPSTAPVVESAYPSNHESDTEHIREAEGFVINGRNFGATSLAYQYKHGEDGWSGVATLDGDEEYNRNEEGTSIDVYRQTVNGIMTDNELDTGDLVKFIITNLNGEGSTSVQRTVQLA